MSGRTYGQYCALAQTLDAVGDRWALLIVRELMSGPQRFTDLQRRLPGIGTNQLATRLRELEVDQLILRRFLAPPAASVVYELTEEGTQLEPAILALVRFGLPRLRTLAPVNTFRAGWAALALRARAGSGQRPDRPWKWEVHVEDEVFHILADPVATVTGPGPVAEADAAMHTDTITAFALVRGDVKLSESLGEGLLRTSDEAACLAWAAHSDLIR